MWMACVRCARWRLDRSQRARVGPQVNQVALATSVNDGRDSIARRFIQQAYGSINFVRHGSYCGGAWRSGSGAVFGDLKKMPHGRPDLENVEFAIFIGTAPGNAGNPFKRTGALRKGACARQARIRGG